MKAAYHPFMEGLAISFVVWTGEDGLKTLVEQLSFFRVCFELFLHQDTNSWKWYYFSRCFSNTPAEPQNLLFRRVQVRTFVGLLVGQLTTPFVRIRFLEDVRSSGFCRIGPEECSAFSFGPRMTRKPMEQVRDGV